MKAILAILLFLLAIVLPFFSANSQRQHGGHQTPAMPGGGKITESAWGREASPTRTFLVNNGFKASFTIRPMVENLKMLKEMKMKIEVDPQATHNIAVTLTDTRFNQPFSDAVVKMKVISPKGQEQIKLLDSIPAMNQYSGDFTLPQKGRYQILILFKAGGKKQAAGFYYRLK